MIHSGQPAKDFIDEATRHVLLRQGVLGIKVKIMRGSDPEGKAGPSKTLPDSVTVIEPKEEQPVVQPMSQDYGAKAVAAQQAAEAAMEAHGLEICLDELEPQRRSLIRTAFFEGSTYEELATRSGTPLGTVKSWIRRSLTKLKACLER